MKLLPWVENPYKLWSILDMLKVSAKEYIEIGQLFGEVKARMAVLEAFGDHPLDDKENIEFVRLFITNLTKCCDDLGAKVASDLLAYLAVNMPKTWNELMMLERVVYSAIGGYLFFHVPQERSKYYSWGVVGSLKERFPGASSELNHSGKCFVFGEYTASVFHAMRAVEIGLRVFARHLNITKVYKGIEYAEQGKLISKIKHAIDYLKDAPKRKQMSNRAYKEWSAKVTFVSDAAAQFDHFKDAYRNNVSHSRIVYNETEAKDILDGTVKFIERLSKKLREPRRD